MKHAICLFLALVILCSSTISVAAAEVTSSGSEPNYLLGLQSYLKTNNDEYLLHNENYAYWLLIEDFESDIVMWEILNAIDLYIGCGTEPDVHKYTEVLVNLIATYDCDNASDIAEQRKNDNLKSALDYAMDIAQLGANSVDLMVGMDESASDLEEWISIAVSGLSTMAGNVDNWIDALSDLETLVQNYTSYDAFLALIEEKSSGDLKAAASSLRTSMETAMKIKLDTYSDVFDENFENYTEFFFTDVFFDALKLSAEYDSDENFKVLVDCGSDFADKVKEFFLNPKKAWDLGIAIGTLVGNVAVGGEDVINRLHELMVLRDIGNILCGELQEIELLYTSGDYDHHVAQRYFELSNYLIGCRLRGEYCRYSIIASDSGLLSKFSFEKAEDAEKWYQHKSTKIMEIRKAIDTACKAILVHIETNGYEVGELSEWYVYDVNGSLCRNYTLRITNKEKMHIGAIVADDFTYPVEHVVTTSDPLLLELDSGYWYTFEITDNTNSENFLIFTVAVNPSSEGLIEMIEVQTDFFAVEKKDGIKKQLNQVKIKDRLNESEQIHTFQYDQSSCLTGTDIAYLYPNMPILNEEVNCRYSYDSSGRLIQADRDDWWLEFSNERFDYDIDGKLLSYKKYWGGEGFDIPYSQVDYQYDAKGSLIKEIHYSQDSTVSIEKDREYSVTCEYDKQNNLIEKRSELSWMQPSTSVTKHTINGHDIWDCNYIEEYTYNSDALVTKEHTFYFFEDDETTSAGDVTTYQYDTKPFVLIRDQSDDSQMRIAINDAVGMSVWSIWVYGDQVITDEDGYVIAVTGDDNYEYEFIYDSNENDLSVESQENWEAAYIPIVEEAIAESGVEMSQGILADMDNDKVPELILSYPWSSDGESWMWKYAFSVYDYEDGTLKTHAEDVSIGASAAAAGGSGYTSIVLYNGNPMIVSYKSSGETSLGNGKYMNRTCKAVIYSFDGIAPHKTLEIETSGNSISYSIDGITVSEEAFETEVNKYEYLTLDNTSAWVSIDCSYETMKLYDLLRYLQANAEMGTASEPKITKAEAAQIAESLWGDYLQRRQGFDWKIFEGESAMKDGVEYYCFTLQSNFTYGSDDWEISEYLFINSVTGEHSNSIY